MTSFGGRQLSAVGKGGLSRNFIRGNGLVTILPTNEKNPDIGYDVASKHRKCVYIIRYSA